MYSECSQYTPFSHVLIYANIFALFFFCLTEVSGLDVCVGVCVRVENLKDFFQSCIYLKGFPLKKGEKKEVDYSGKNFILLGKSIELSVSYRIVCKLA